MRFSRRTAVDTRANRITEEILRLRSAGRKLLDLTQSNPTEAGLSYPESRIKEALTPKEIFRYEASPKGILAARRAVSEYLEGKVDPDSILLTASTSEAYSYLFKLLCDPGDSVLAPRPSYPLIDVLAKLEDVHVQQYALYYDYGWHIDIESLRRAVKDTKARAVLFVNPNNPTGSFLSSDDYAALVELCVVHGLALICDEVFSDYGFAPGPSSNRSVAGRADVLTFALSGLSKICGLPQLKLGWIAVSGPSRAVDEATERLEWISDSFLTPGAPVQWATATLLTERYSIQEQIRHRTQRNLKKLLGKTAESPLKVLKAEGGWYATLRVPRIRPEEEWVLELLRRHSVLVQPGFFFDFEDEAYLILSLLTETKTFDAGVTALLNLAGVPD